MKHMFEGIPLEDEDIYKSISNDNGKKRYTTYHEGASIY